MKTSTQYRGILLIVLGSAIISGSAMAQDQNAYLYIAHAASGRVISSTTNPALPVDMSVMVSASQKEYRTAISRVRSVGPPERIRSCSSGQMPLPPALGRRFFGLCGLESG